MPLERTPPRRSNVAGVGMIMARCELQSRCKAFELSAETV
jgi:hypothetical protein